MSQRFQVNDAKARLGAPVNVSCHQCSKKYVIPDDKLAGKASVKIRCKQCQAVISVTVSQAAAPAVAAAPAPSPSAPPPDEGATWYAMVKGQQVGPLDLEALAARAAAGELTARTYVWRPGQGDWKRAADVPEVSGIVTGAAVSRPAAEAPRTPTRGADAAAPAASATASRAAGAQAAPLQDLFGELGGTAETAAPASEPLAPAAEPSPSAQPDPFAQLSQGDTGQAPPIGEATRFFIAQAGVNKRNPPWKVALFAALFVGLPVGLVYLLQSFHIVELPTVARTNEDGTVTQESFFSPEGMSGLKDLLTGDARKKQDEAERKRREKQEREAQALARRQAAQGQAGQPGQPGQPADVADVADDPPPTPRPQDPSLAAFYQDDDKKTVGPKVRKGDDQGGGAAVNSSGLSPEAVAKVVADKSKAFQLCIDQALHRNPNLAVGNVTVVLTVGASGGVKGSAIEPRKHEGSDWGQCMLSASRRIVFPASDGETQVELPFKVGVAMAP